MATATARATLLIRNKRHSEASGQLCRIPTAQAYEVQLRKLSTDFSRKEGIMKGISSEWKCLIGVVLVSAIILIYLGLMHPSAYAGPDTIDGARAMISTAIMMIACTGIFWHRNKD